MGFNYGYLCAFFAMLRVRQEDENEVHRTSRSTLIDENGSEKRCFTMFFSTLSSTAFIRILNALSTKR